MGEENQNENTMPVNDNNDTVSIDGITFSKEQAEIVNKQLSAEKNRAQRALDEAKALRAKADLTDGERKDIDKRIEDLQNQLMTKEELAKQEKDKIVKNYEKQVKETSEEASKWKTRFIESTITNSILSAATTNNAYNPNQLLAIIRPNASLVEDVDDNGKATGQFKTKVKIHTKSGDDGKPITLELEPNEAVKKMSEMDEYLNLFKSDGATGFGGTNRSNSGGNLDIATLAKDQAKYEEARRSGKLKIS